VTIIDISLPIHSGMVVYEGDPGVSVTPRLEIARGDTSNVSVISLGSHTGTHLDAPAHFIEGGATAEALPVALLCGLDVGHARLLISREEAVLLPRAPGGVKVAPQDRATRTIALPASPGRASLTE